MFKRIKETLSKDYVIGGIIFGLMIAATVGCIGYALYEEFTNPGSTTTTASAPMKTRANGGFGYGFGYSFKTHRVGYGWGVGNVNFR
jgi:hypothetical protein